MLYVSVLANEVVYLMWVIELKQVARGYSSTTD